MRSTRFSLTSAMCAMACLALVVTPAHAQDSCIRILAQDSTLNNLVDPPGYKPARLGTLGAVKRSGTGEQAIILIPGLGFGGDIFDELTPRLSKSYRKYAVTLPGFGGTPAPPAPGGKVSFADQTWTTGALTAIEKLIEEEHLQSPIVIGHWLTGTQLALRLAMRHPQQIKAVVLLAGSAKMVLTDTTFARYYATLERRVASVDGYLAARWFKTVTRETWDDNNFLPGDYATHPVRGLRLWREAASPDLHVWVRYLCEFDAQDISLELDRVAVPTLLLRPGLEGNWHQPGQDYMRAYCYDSWEGRIERHPKVAVKNIPDARVCMWFDQPQRVEAAITTFLESAR
jgi:pimeloyl-ACP methyl ester carboxylesterase